MIMSFSGTCLSKTSVLPVFRSWRSSAPKSPKHCIWPSCPDPYWDLAGPVTTQQRYFSGIQISTVFCYVCGLWYSYTRITHPWFQNVSNLMCRGDGSRGLTRCASWSSWSHGLVAIWSLWVNLANPFSLRSMLQISAANAFMRCMYRAGLWLSHEERDFLLKAGTRCVNSFLRCALRAFNASATRWKFMPKFHLFGEWLFTMEKQKRLGLPSPNLLMFSCQMDEDYVGRISSISRTVSLRTVHTRTLTRYLIALVANWGWICYLI